MDDKVEEYFKVLYPDYDNLSEDEQWRAEEDRRIIEKNIEIIETMIQDGTPIKEAVRMGVNYARADDYFKTVYPNFTELTGEEKYNAAEMKGYIRRNVETIKNLYDEIIQKMIKDAMKEGKPIDQQLRAETIKKAINQSMISVKDMANVAYNPNLTMEGIDGASTLGQRDLEQGEKQPGDN